ncbi:MAG: hypothetical protein VB102_01695 [Paludibacter sp.]|nr:hypothetical protein [Paludibacter sp.]
MKKTLLFLLIINLFACKNEKAAYPEFSGIYPHLAYYNVDEGECGTGAVVSWADRLWVITYGPHFPFGSSDKLYEITPDLRQIIRPESTGGTHANRFIHKESNQLFIGPYCIDSLRNVRVLRFEDVPGRYTGMARHLTDPTNKIYLATMEEGFYEIDVHSLQTKVLYEDGVVKNKEAWSNHDDTNANKPNPLLPGAHGKGLYSGQGVLVYSNNGEAHPDALTNFDLESGVLAEWDAKTWKVIRRNQFVEVTGPGGIYGNLNPGTDPIWATGWDSKSIITGVRGAGKWHFYRLPKASSSYDGAHGWNTEWPRIRNVGTDENPDYLMTMHGMFWRYPSTFSATNTAGIRPRSAYLKVVGDFTRWNNRLVFGCDDSAQKEFLNKRKAKGNIEGPGQSNSNLWFTSIEKPDELGITTATGAVWMDSKLKKYEVSEPFLFAGWEKRCAWLANQGKEEVNFLLQIDKKGDNNWSNFKNIIVPAGKTRFIEFKTSEQGEWIRAQINKNTQASLVFAYTGNPKSYSEQNIFQGISKISDMKSVGGLLYGLGDNRRALGILAGHFEGDKFIETGYYEVDGNMSFDKKEDVKIQEFIRSQFAIPQKAVSIEASSVLIVDDQSRRWRLPLGNEKYKALTESASLRICREVATERDLFNCMGTFYELPAENADGYAKIRPVSSHNFRIHDYASYRGLLIMTGLDKNAKANPHIIRSSDGKAMIWAGTIDDLWTLGKPVGHGGPWKNTSVKSGEYSDPYLIGFYDKKEMRLSHNADKQVTFTIEINPLGHGSWMKFTEFTVKPNETFQYNFPESFQARWIRFKTNTDCQATTYLTYK